MLIINDEAGNQSITIIRCNKMNKVESENVVADKNVQLTDMLVDMLTDINRAKLEELSNYLISHGRIDNATLECNTCSGQFYY
ncbi:unknown [Bacteroides sp. CAG:754]|jgi:hypothetical protein|nr:unknown [Bacteroides sp. CAG:754]